MVKIFDLVLRIRTVRVWRAPGVWTLDGTGKLYQAASPPLYSPDRRHVAIIIYALQLALGDDYATVRVRRCWVPWATVAYSGPAGWDFKNNKPGDPEVRWLDSVHLLIRYHDYRNGTGGSVCRSQIGAIGIICHPITSAGAR